jgi:HSP20 family protein
VERWYYRSLFDEIEEMRNYMESLTRQMYNTNPLVMLPAPGSAGVKMLPARRTSFAVNVTEAGDEVVVTADLIPGVKKTDITLDLINPQALEISCELTEEKSEEGTGYARCERTFGSIMRVIALPATVTDERSSAVVLDGVLEVHLKKTTGQSRGRIPID